jgi:NADH dehydrogenase (ubiquinone) 1 alpha subcomplex subunit 6
VATPQVVDLLVYKGREELEMVLLNHKQRHHLVAQYVRLPETRVAAEALPGGGPPPSAFLEAFYRGG